MYSNNVFKIYISLRKMMFTAVISVILVTWSVQNVQANDCINKETCKNMTSGPIHDQFCSQNFWLCMDKQNYLCRRCPDEIPYWDAVHNRCKNDSCHFERPYYLGQNKSGTYSDSELDFIIMSDNFADADTQTSNKTFFLTTTLSTSLKAMVQENIQLGTHLHITDVISGQKLVSDAAILELKLDPGVYQFDFQANSVKQKFALRLTSADNGSTAGEQPSSFEADGKCVNSHTCVNKSSGPTADIFCSNYFWLCSNGANLECRKCPQNRPYWDSFNNKCSKSCTNPSPITLCSKHSVSYNDSQYAWLIDSPGYPARYTETYSCTLYLTTSIPSNLTSSKFEIKTRDSLYIQNIFTGLPISTENFTDTTTPISLPAGVYMLKFTSQKQDARNRYNSYNRRYNHYGKAYSFRLQLSSDFIEPESTEPFQDLIEVVSTNETESGNETMTNLTNYECKGIFCISDLGQLCQSLQRNFSETVQNAMYLPSLDVCLSLETVASNCSRIANGHGAIITTTNISIIAAAMKNAWGSSDGLYSVDGILSQNVGSESGASGKPSPDQEDSDGIFSETCTTLAYSSTEGESAVDAADCSTTDFLAKICQYNNSN